MSGNFYQPATIGSDGPNDSQAAFGDPQFVAAAGNDFRPSLTGDACRSGTSDGAYGALNCGAAVRMSVVQFDPVQQLVRLRVTGPPRGTIRLESAAGLSAGGAGSWTPEGPRLPASPVGAFFALPLDVGAATERFYRAVVTAPAP